LRLLLAIILFFQLVPLRAQHGYRFAHLGINDGLSQNSVSCIYQDSKGYIWLGTQDGLNRYDGYSFQTFRYDRTDTSSLSDNFILSIAEDKTKKLWIGTRRGLNIFDPATGKAIRIFMTEEEKRDFHSMIHTCYAASPGEIQFINKHYDLYHASITASGKGPIMKLAAGVKMASAGKKGSWLIMNSDLRYSENSNDSGRIIAHGITDNHKINFIFEDSKGRVWIGGPKLLCVNRSTGAIELPSLPSNAPATAIAEDTQGNIWLGTGNGLFILNNDSTVTNLQNDPSEPLTLTYNVITYIFRDKAGMMWVGTAGGGVNIYDPSTAVFKTAGRKELPAPGTWALLQDGKELWVGTTRGCTVFHLRSRQFSEHRSFEENIESAEEIMLPGSSPSTVTAIARMPGDAYWLGTSRQGIFILDKNKKVIRNLTASGSNLTSDAVFHIYTAPSGKIWVSTMNGLNLYDPAKQSFIPYTTKEYPAIPGNYIFSVYEDKNKDTWVGTAAGMFRIRNNGTIQTYTNNYGDPHSLSYNMVTGFLEDKEGRFWVSTLGGGINLVDRDKGTFTSFAIQNGLANDAVYGLMEDGKGKLWMSTNSGLSSFDPAKKIFRNFTARDGIVANEYSQNALYKNALGELLFGSPEGFVVFHPDSILAASYQPPLVLQRLLVNDTPKLLSEDETLELHRGDRTISFQFAALDYHRSNILYTYTLEGFDTKWIISSPGARTATYTNLPPGNYTLRAKARNSEGTWYANEVSLPITVIPPVWMRWWFISIAAIAVLTIVILLVRYYSHRKLVKRMRAIEMQQKIQEERERISRDLHDHVGANLVYIISSLDSISYKVGKDGKPDTQDKVESLGDFARDTMQQLRETIWAINKDEITVKELAGKIKEHLAKMLSVKENTSFEVTLEAPADKLLKPSQAIHLFRVAQEAISNALKHSGARHLRVAIVLADEKKLVLEISDDGKGFDTSLRAEGHYGLDNMSSRVKELGGELTVSSKANSGTIIRATIPAAHK
jgi:signal transduction histidine kinase/ligand-binding sensor domain-containing protein